jgi:hypothetical protein
MIDLKNQINQYKKELMGLGYREGEVLAFIYDATGGKDIAEVVPDQYEEVIQYLADYVAFAKKSRLLVTG